MLYLRKASNTFQRLFLETMVTSMRYHECEASLSLLGRLRTEKFVLQREVAAFFYSR
jgi:hypothetical protein